MKILYITTIGGTMHFFKSLIKELIDEGHIVDIATNETASKVPDCYREWGCKIFPISTSRSPFCLGNVKAIKEIRNIAKNYDIVHCHTPLAGMATRLACKPLRKKGLKVFYTAHGFHFYKGAPIKNWLIYYPIEKICSRWTDTLITINKEDYERAKRCMHAKNVEYVPGVGIDVDKFKNTVVDRNEKRKEIGVPEDAFLILSVGELNENKNHQVVIRALGQLKDNNIHYVIAGEGDKKEYLAKLAKGLNVNLHLLGHRSDVAELYKTADVFCLPSKREGLNVSIMEAMASGLPCIVSNVRGCSDLSDKNIDGLCESYNADSFLKAITKFYNKEHLNNFERDLNAITYTKINLSMKKIYCEVK